MAWYRAGGSGIPASVKTDMNNVLNKKMGTTGQTYPPQEWADDVNLMGLLEEKTASGAIASFSDGADDVPTRSLIVTIPATLEGVSSVTETKNGKNFIPLLTWYSADYSYTNAGVTFKVLSDGGIRITGKTTGTYSQFNIVSYTSTPTTQWQFYIPKGQFTFSLSGIIDKIRMVISGSGNNGFAYSEVTYTNQFKTGTVTDNTKPFNYVILRVYPTDEDIDVTVYPQCEVGSTAHAYEPYQTPTQYTASLGRTIYGGSVDVVKGTAEPTNWLDENEIIAGKQVRGTDGEIIASSASNVSDYIAMQDSNMTLSYDYSSLSASANRVIGYYDENKDFISAESYDPTPKTFNLTIPSTAKYCVITLDKNVTDVQLEKGTAKTDYSPYFEPFTFTGQEVPTRLGYNNFYADVGNTAVEYRASGTTTPILPTLITKTITENGTYDAEDDNADGYSEVTVNVAGGGLASVSPVLSNNAFVTQSGVSGTDTERTARTITMTEAGKLVFAEGSYCTSNTGANDGYFDIRLNGTSVVKQYITTNTNTPISIPEIDVESGDAITFVVGFDNQHSSCNFQLYTAITFVVGNIVFANNADDPFEIMSDYTRFNIQNLYSSYYLADGVIKKEIVFQMNTGSGYEGFCISLDGFNLTSGTNYTLSFVLDVPTTATFSGTYPWGIKYSSTRVPTSGSASTNTFNVTPTVDFAEQTGTQNVSITFTASSTNYLVVLLSRLAGSITTWFKMRDIQIEEVTT